MSALSKRSIIVAGSQQVSCELAGEAVILHLDRGMYYGLDPVGARIWNLIQEPRRIVDVRETLLAEYEVDRDRCQADLLALIRDLRAEGLIDVRDAAAP